MNPWTVIGWSLIPAAVMVSALAVLYGLALWETAEVWTAILQDITRS